MQDTKYTLRLYFRFQVSEGNKVREPRQHVGLLPVPGPAVYGPQRSAQAEAQPPQSPSTESGEPHINMTSLEREITEMEAKADEDVQNEDGQGDTNTEKVGEGQSETAAASFSTVMETTKDSGKKKKKLRKLGKTKAKKVNVNAPPTLERPGTGSSMGAQASTLTPHI